MPFLSVVIPTYNRKDSLRRTLDGLACQDFPTNELEVIVVSDGATDGTDEFLTQYAETAPYALRPITQTNSGPARARNRGIQDAQGEIIVFLDDDVEPLPECLAAHAAHHRANSQIVIIGPMSPDPARRADEPAWIAWEHAMLEKQYTAWRTGEWPGAGPNHFYTGNASLRRAHLIAVGGFDETFQRQEDVEMAYRMKRDCGVHFHFEPGAFALHRPTRTFEAWLRVPFAYGRLDVVRAQRGDATWEVVQDNYHARSQITRALARFILRAPATSAPLRRLLTHAANTLVARGRLRPAIVALSVLYNLRYLEGAHSELGSPEALRRVLSL